MPTDEPIGHLPVDHQAARDAAAGPPIGPAPRGPDWPGELKPSQKYRGGGGYHPGGMRFGCCDCPDWSSSIHDLIRHVIAVHNRGPYLNERVPQAAPVKPVKGRR